MDEPNSIEARDAQRSESGKLSRQIEANDLKWLMSTKQGRRFMRKVLAMSGVHRSSFTGNSETFFREGRRSLGLDLLAEVTRETFDEYLQMIAEGKPQ